MTRPSTSAPRRTLWIGTSLIAGVIMLVFANSKGLFQNPDTRVFEVSVFFGAWLAIVLLVRVFSKRFRSFEDLTVPGLFKRDDDDSSKQ
jgi:hypothetical protein